jgi:hypothetical protein
MAITLKEVTGTQLLVAMGACKMLRVPGFTKCCYHLKQKSDSNNVKIVQKEVLLNKLSMLLLQEHLIFLKHFNWTFVTFYKCDHKYVQKEEMYLPNNWLVAGTTATLLCSVNTLTAHVCLQVAKHRVQLILFSTPSSRRTC